MAKKKDGKSLFEVIGTGQARDSESLDVPSWFDQAGQPPAAAPGPAGAAAEKTAPPHPPQARPAVPAAPREPTLSVSGGRMRMSLNQVSAIVVLTAIILLGAGAFLVGRRTAPKAPATAQDRLDAPHKSSTTRLGTDRRSVVPVPGTVHDSLGRHTPSMVSGTATRLKGYSYLVIQGGVHTHQEAKDIQRFLYRKGIDATVHWVAHTKTFKVKDMQGFRNIYSPQTQAAIEEHVAQIERLGTEYQNQGGRYGFKQSRRTGIWMETEK